MEYQTNSQPAYTLACVQMSATLPQTHVVAWAPSATPWYGDISCAPGPGAYDLSKPHEPHRILAGCTLGARPHTTPGLHAARFSLFWACSARAVINMISRRASCIHNAGCWATGAHEAPEMHGDTATAHDLGI